MDYIKNISDQIIDRGVELWVRALAQPKFNNGDESWNGVIGEAFAIKIATDDRDACEDYNVAIERFRMILSARLKFLRDNTGKPRAAFEIQQDKENKQTHIAAEYHFDSYLSCDYGPDRTLAWAANKAGLPHSAFSYKSDVSLSPACVAARFGYGAENVNHYPMPDGRWLITTLCGGDIDKIIKGVMEKRITELTIEPVN